jgi:N-acetylgalactosamine-6-sulfatase
MSTNSAARSARLATIAVGAAVAMGPSAAPSAHAAASVKQPNIIIVLCDDMGYSDLGCFGNRTIRTPHLDRLAAQGTRFTQFYATSPVCSPTRAALLTGQYPQRHGIHHADVPESLPRYWLPESAVTIAELLQRAGYHTVHIGKWHLGEPPDAVAPRKQGFDFFFGLFGGRPSSSWIRYARSMDPEMILNEERPVVHKGHVTAVQTQAALDALDRAPRDRPFFLNLWYNAPHEPLAPLPDQDKLYRDWSPEEQTYFQTVTDIDTGVGQILAKLDERGLADDTLVLFTSDNGPEVHRSRYSRGSAWPLKGMKTQLWEGGIRVPALLRWPGKVPAGKTSEVVTGILDIFPTLCAAATLPRPAGLKLDGGLDLLPIANGSTKGTDRPLFFEFHFPQRGAAPSLPMAVRRGAWKLFADHDFSAVALYNLEEDIGEQNDLAAANPRRVQALKSDLQRWWTQFADKVDLNPPRKPVPVPTPEELEARYYRN